MVIFWRGCSPQGGCGLQATRAPQVRRGPASVSLTPPKWESRVCLEPPWVGGFPVWRRRRLPKPREHCPENGLPKGYILGDIWPESDIPGTFCHVVLSSFARLPHVTRWLSYKVNIHNRLGREGNPLTLSVSRGFRGAVNARAVLSTEPVYGAYINAERGT